MLSHITVGCTDLERAVKFYEAALTPLGLRRRPVAVDGGPEAACWFRPEAVLPRFYVYKPFNRQHMSVGNGSMVAFLATSHAAVDSAYEAALANGGTDEGAPGLRLSYGQGYYGAYVRDPDGNKLHFVHRGDLVSN